MKFIRKTLAFWCIKVAEKLLAWAPLLDGKRGFKVVWADHPGKAEDDAEQLRVMRKEMSLKLRTIRTIQALCNESERMLEPHE